MKFMFTPISGEKAKKKEDKLEKLRKLANPRFTGNGGKHEFHDASYNKEREQATDRVHEAVEQAFAKKKLENKPSTSESPSNSDESENSSNKINWAKRKAESLPKPSNKSGISKPKKGLWVGVDLDDSDLETSSDEEIEIQSAKNKGKGKGKSSASKAISVN